MLGVHISRALEDQHLQEDVTTDGVDEDEKKMRVTAKEIVNEAGTAEYAKAQPVVHTVLGELPTALAPALAPPPAQLWMGVCLQNSTPFSTRASKGELVAARSQRRGKSPSSRASSTSLVGS